MKLITEELIILDKEIHNFNSLYGLMTHSLNEVPNLKTIEMLVEKISEIKKKLESIKTDNEFENIFIENHLLNLENQRIYAQYFSKRDKERVDEIIEIFFGKDIIKLIEERIKNFNYEADWNFYLSYQNYSYRSFPSDSPELQERFKDILSKLKKDILAYAREHYCLSEDYEFSLVLGQPYSQNSAFTPSTQRVEISPSTFFAYKDGEEVKIINAATIQTVFHEFIGHALQEFNSRDLPLSIRDDSINTSVPTMRIHAEGFAQLADKESLKFSKKFAKEYQIEDAYLKQRELYFNRKEIGLFWNYYQYLKLKNLEDSSFDYKKKFMSVANNFGALLNYEHSSQSPFSFFKNISYFVGLTRIEQLHGELIEEFGEKNEPIINKALSTGLLNVNILPKFARYFIRQNIDAQKA